jgi:uncharacterized protein
MSEYPNQLISQMTAGPVFSPDVPFVPRRFLSNGHLQTLAGNFSRRENRLPAPEERLFNVEEEVQVLCHCHWQPDREQRLTVVLVHGLEGSSLSQYVIGVGSKAWDVGMNVVRMNMRNCGGTERLARTLYHSGLSSDVGAVIKTLIQQDKLQRIAAAGYSMGGNLVLKLAGEWGNNAPPEILAVAAVSPAADLGPSADAMHTEWSNRIYEWKFLISLMRRYGRKSVLFPDVYKKVARYPRSIREFDEFITARHNGFTGADDYYNRASAARVVDRIAVPTLVIHSNDDPFIRMLPETRAVLAGNPNVTVIETERGGHCAFLAEPDDSLSNHDDGRWAERQIIRFFQQHMTD